ncbi:MAG: hypothetical protein D6706_21490, partial [Chloroflexi bacterium]
MHNRVFLGLFLLVLLAACASSQTATPTPIEATAVPQPTSTTQTTNQPAAYVLFAINVQDFTYPAESAAVLDKLITLHEETAV